MSPRYFAKFTGSHDQNAGNWFHFSPKDYNSNSPELKLHFLKVRIYLTFKKIFKR